ncbi:MAG: ArsR family transcriptional regulator [Romboutsia timonensis]|uniref:ArsR/SmtB family transcription factor n=1 Tax=Romboutsia TaxID=1501226 RepID=UPI0021708914|nr:MULTISPECIES: ArsR family transcriptional regulator [Romboutsia]MCI9258926.1 ArsR family transcriptional regulator [Romboutsia sp.]MDY3001700.1 ArsR family transcriptional regulator [Romboutsia timonensis]
MNNKNLNKIYIKALDKNLAFFQALASETRLKIISLIQNKEMSIKDLSDALGMSSAVVTKHINKLENVGIVESYAQPGVRGLLKLCKIKTSEVQVILNNNYEENNNKFTEIDIPIGSYSSFKIYSPCGLASKDKLFGILDDPRYFASPNRNDISLIWFTSGYLEYSIPIYDIDFSNLNEIEISLEICSEFPGYNNSFKSDIYFYLNDISLGKWTSPGDFGDRKGVFTPSWWDLGTEYGLLKIIKINSEGVYLDGIKLSDTSLSDYLKENLDCISFKIECPKDTQNPGGINIFGENFGNFNQNIKVKCYYK